MSHILVISLNSAFLICYAEKARFESSDEAGPSKKPRRADLDGVACKVIVHVGDAILKLCSLKHRAEDARQQERDVRDVKEAVIKLCNDVVLDMSKDEDYV